MIECVSLAIIAYFREIHVSNRDNQPLGEGHNARNHEANRSPSLDMTPPADPGSGGHVTKVTLSARRAASECFPIR